VRARERARLWLALVFARLCFILIPAIVLANQMR
jgi:hypothetical protein